MLISFPPEGDQKSPSLRSGFWRANIVGSFLCPHTVLRLDPQAGQARKDKQALGLRPSFASLHQCLLVASEASPWETRRQAKLEKTSKQ